jgi:hypothetical protein
MQERACAQGTKLPEIYSRCEPRAAQATKPAHSIILAALFFSQSVSGSIASLAGLMRTEDSLLGTERQTKKMPI